jgi:hypothetical protein
VVLCSLRDTFVHRRLLCRSYYTILQVGLYNYRVALDTGSSDLWMVSSDCTTKICKQVPRLPLDEQSPTFQSVENNSTQFGLGYADGTGMCSAISVNALFPNA